MTLFQIIMVAVMSAGFAVAFGFAIAFIVEATRGYKTVKTVKKVKETKVVIDEEPVKEDDNIRKMLAQLEAETQEEEVKPAPSVSVVNLAELEDVIEQEEPVLVDVAEPEKEQPVVIEIPVESQPEPQPVATVVEEPAALVEEEIVVEETTEETEISEDDDDIEIEEENYDEEDESPKTIVIEKVTTETVGTDFDYSVRLAKIIESKNKMERDLQKTKRAITKYERTQRRRTRNQKMLDRRAVELTNLNLMMYSVTDIKNVDADKKAKQEELTTHIAELKASIQDADLFLAKNKERYEHDKKMYAFYTKEEARYNDEIKELEILIKNANNVTGSTTTTTTTTTTETVS